MTLLAEILNIVHFLWILFLLFGLYFVLKKSRIAYIHAAGLLFSLLLNLMGWYCPLTLLEGYLEPHQGPGVVEKSFVGRALEKIVYPEVNEGMIRAGGVVFVLLNGVVYAWAIKGAIRAGKR